MRIGAPLVLDTPVDRATLENLLDWQAAWACWRPRRLQVVPILAPAQPVAPAARLAPNVAGAGRGSITSFSGGVDSCFSAWRHTRPETPGPSERRIGLGAGLTVHGFDIPLDQPESFDRVRERTKALLSAFGLEAFWLRTDVRKLEDAFGCAWETEAHGLWLAAALACLEPWYEGTMIPSTYPHACLRLPWGSNPIGDPLLGSEGRPCRHDGAAYTKLDKVRAMAADPAVADGVRVCWEGMQLDRNCGGCFKCIATQVCFWLSGVEQPAAFPTRCGLDDVDATMKSAMDWLEHFAACVRAQDFDGGRALFAPEARGFGTVVERAVCRQQLEEGQWRRIWPNTRDFRLIETSREVFLSADGSQACVLALWDSEAREDEASGQAPFHRRGRCTLLLERDEGSPWGWRAIHSHFSKRPSGEV